MRMRLFPLLALALSMSTAPAQESVFDGTQTMTAEEEHEAENYIHKGVAEQKYIEMCQENPEQCHGEEAWTSDQGMSKVDAMMPMVTKAYAMFSGMLMPKMDAPVKSNGEPVLVGENGEEYSYSERKGSYVNSENEKVTQDEMGETKEKTEEKTDMCGKIPMVVEGLSLAFQQTQNNQTQQNLQNAQPQAAQRAQFEALAKMHDDRSEAATMQAAGWGSVTACYAYYAASGAAVMDTKMIAKMAASGLITTFYVAKIDAHKDRRDALLAMADDFPNAGDCNPHTATTCFCAEPTSRAADPANYQKYCVAPELRRDNNMAGYPCADKNGKPDLKCGCKKTNSCINATLAHDAVALGLNPADMKNPLSGISPLSTGHSNANLRGITERNLAMANKALKDIKPRDKLNIGSNPKAKKLAKELFKHGLPKAAAASLAKHTAGSDGALPPGLTSGSVASIPSKSSGNSAYRPSKDNVMKKGRSVRGASKSSKGRINPFGRRRKSSARGTSGVDIMDFAQKAAREAEITKDKSKPIFEIITYRYKMRAWKEFKDEIQNHIESEKEQK